MDTTDDPRDETLIVNEAAPPLPLPTSGTIHCASVDFDAMLGSYNELVLDLKVDNL